VDRARTNLGAAALLLGVFIVALAARLRGLDAASTGSDALGQFLAAWSVGPGHLPNPPNPEGGHALWVLAWPLVHLAGSLRELFMLRFALAALIAPLTAAAVLLLAGAGARRWGAAAAAGVLVSVDPGLLDTLVVAFRGYGAPEMAALASVGLGLAMADRPIGLLLIGPAVVAAAGQHPMGAGLALGVLAVLPDLARRWGRRWIAAAVAVGVIAALPRLLWVLHMADCGRPAAECLAGVALSSSEPSVGPGELLRRALHDRLVVELGAPALGFWAIAGLAGRIREARTRVAALWVSGCLLGVIVLGLSVHSLRPYHLRVVAAPLAIAAVLGAGRAWPLLLIWVGVAGAAWWPERATSRHLRAVDSLAEQLLHADTSLRVDTAYFGTPVGLDPAAVVLSAVLQGCPADRFSLDARAGEILIVSSGPDPGAGARQIGAGPGWVALRFADRRGARAWVDAQSPPPVFVGGAWDWAVALYPRAVDLAEASW